jgi:hypothetical protein
MANFQELLSEAYQLLDTARMLNASDKNRLEFVNTQLELSRAFAERALAVSSAGDVHKAKQSALAAKAAYRSVQKSLPKLLVKGEQRESIVMKLGNLTPLIEKLSAIS